MLKNSDAKAVYFSFEVQPERMLVKYIHDENLPIYLPSMLETMDFNWLKNRILEAKLKWGCNIVLIDHMHFMVDMSTKQNMSLNIGGFMRKLKQEIAIGLNMAVILIAHQGQPKEEKEASIHGLRDSSFVAQECDAVVVVSRRQNMSTKDLATYREKYGEERLSKFFPPALTGYDIEDEYSAGLAVVKVACHRRTGVYDAKKMFKKVGNFMEEI
jgi:replicative DNA helicase